MSITLSCPSCGETLQAKDEHAGKTLKCPKCKTSIAVPGADSPAGDAANDESRLFCRDCGAPIPDAAQPFCRECGTPVRAANAPGEAGTGQPASAQPPRPSGNSSHILKNLRLSEGEMHVRSYRFASTKRLFRFVSTGYCHLALTNKRVIFNAVVYEWFQRNERYVEIPMESVGCIRSDFLRSFPLIRVFLAAAALIFFLICIVNNRLAPVDLFFFGLFLGHYLGIPNGTYSITSISVTLCLLLLAYILWMVYCSKRSHLVLTICSSMALGDAIKLDGPHSSFALARKFFFTLITGGLYLLFAGFTTPFSYLIYDITPTPSARTMLREMGAIILDIKTQGDRGAKKWQQRTDGEQGSEVA